MRTLALLTCAMLAATSVWAQDGAEPTPAEAPAAAPAPAAAAEPADPVERLSYKLNRLYKADSSASRIAMRITSPHFNREVVIETKTLGSDKMVMRILSPAKDAGIQTLMVGREMWNYLPKVKRAVKILPSMVMGSWMGSDFAYDDLLRATSWEKDYTAKRSEDAPAGQICLDYLPRPEAPVSWQKVHTCFDAASELPVSQKWFDEHGRLARLLTLDRVKDMDGRQVPTRLTLTPVRDKGRQTVIEYLDLDFDVAHEPAIFTLERVKQGS